MQPWLSTTEALAGEAGWWWGAESQSGRDLPEQGTNQVGTVAPEAGHPQPGPLQGLEPALQ